MKKCSLARILIAAIVATGAYQAQAPDEYLDIAEYEKLGQSSMTFLDIDVGARSVGMGGVYMFNLFKDAGNSWWLDCYRSNRLRRPRTANRPFSR